VSAAVQPSHDGGMNQGHLFTLPVLNPLEIQRFIELVYPPTVSGGLSIACVGNFAGKHFRRTDIQGITDHVRSLDAGSNPGIYLRATTCRLDLAPWHRGEAVDSVELPGLWADIDFGVAGHAERKDLSRPSNEADAASIVSKAGLPAPTLWIHSGGGLYPWWLLHEPFEVTSETQAYLATLSRKWHLILQAAAKREGWHYGPEACDLARVLRLPGTVNRKVGDRLRPCYIHSDNGPRYLLQDLHYAAEAAVQRWNISVAVSSTAHRASSETVNEFLTGLPDPHGVPCTKMAEWQDRWINAVQSAGPSCHDEGLRGSKAIAMLAAECHRGALTTMEALQTAWLAIRQPGATTGQAMESADSEWARLEQGAWSQAAGYAASLGTDDASKFFQDSKLCHCDRGGGSPLAMTDEGKKKDKPLRRLPLIPDSVWERRPWLQEIRDKARETEDCPDAVLGAALGMFAASMPYRVRIKTGIKRPLNLSLLVGLVSPPGMGKSSAIDLALDEFAPLETPAPKPTPTGEGLAEELMGWVVHSNPTTGKEFKKHEQVKHNALFTIDEGAALNIGLERSGATLGPVLRQVFSGSALGTTTASADRNRYIPRGNYSISVIVAYQESTAMDVIRDTDTGTAQRFLWFSALDDGGSGSSGLIEAGRMETPAITTLPQSTAVDGTQLFELPVEPAITRWLRTETRRRKATAVLGEPDHDSHIGSILAKLAGLFCLIEGRTLVTMDDWTLAREIHQVSCAVRDELVDLDEEKDRDRRREHAAKAGESDHVRKSYRSEVGKVAASITSKVMKLGRAITKREVVQAITSKKRAYIAEALELAVLETGWLVETDGKYGLGPTPLE
jgi:hypothetical protein